MLINNNSIKKLCNIMYNYFFDMLQLLSLNMIVSHINFKTIKEL